MRKETTNIILIAATALIIGALAGYFYGISSAKQKVAEADKKTESVQQSLDIFVPPLPDAVNVIGGKIAAISGDSFTIEIQSLTDRYPKPGVPMALETKTIRVTADTKLTSTDFNSKTFKNGFPQTKIISADDLRAGDAVSVTVSENARLEQNLTAVSINQSSGI